MAGTVTDAQAAGLQPVPAAGDKGAVADPAPSGGFFLVLVWVLSME